MILDNDQQIKKNIDNVELSHEMLKDLGWRVKYDSSHETAFEHDRCKGTTILLRHYHYYLGSKYYALWWSDEYNVYSSRVEYVGELYKKLNKIFSQPT